jgi:hypothetical protein
MQGSARVETWADTIQHLVYRSRADKQAESQNYWQPFEQQGGPSEEMLDVGNPRFKYYMRSQKPDCMGVPHLLNRHQSNFEISAPQLAAT